MRRNLRASKRVILGSVLGKYVSFVRLWGRQDSTESPKGGLPVEVPKILVKPLGNNTNAYDNSYALAA